MGKGIIAASTLPGMPDVWPLLAAAGYAVEAFPADGAGGRVLEAGVRAGRFAGVLDLAAAELAAELFGWPGGAGPDRLTAAGLMGVPQVISVAMNRELSPEQADRLGLEIAQKACAAKGPTAILLPMKGAVPGALFQSLHNWIYGVEVVELSKSVSGAEFSAAAEAKLLHFLGEHP